MITLERFFEKIKTYNPPPRNLNNPMKINFPFIILILLSEAMVARTWTSTDGSRSFEGEFIKYENDMVSIKRGSRALTFPISKLSTADQNWVLVNYKGQESSANSKQVYEIENTRKLEISLELDTGYFSSPHSVYPHKCKDVELYGYAIAFPLPQQKSVDGAFRLTSPILYKLEDSYIENKWRPPGGEAGLGLPLNSELSEFNRFSVSYIPDYFFDAEVVEGIYELDFDKKMKSFKKFPSVSFKFDMEVSDKVYDVDFNRIKMEVYQGLKKSDYGSHEFVSSNLLPPPDWIEEILGSDEDMWSRSLSENIDLVCLGLHKFCEYTLSIYGNSLSEVYNSTKCTKWLYPELVAAFFTHMNIPMRKVNGVGVKMKSSQKFDYVSSYGWFEFFVPEVGWVPIDLYYIFDHPKSKKNYFGNLSNLEVIRIPLVNELRRGISLTIIYKNEVDGQPKFARQYLPGVVTDVDIKVLK